MVASIQLDSVSPPLLNAEPYNPEQIVIVLGELFFSILSVLQTPVFLLSQIKKNNIDVREIAILLDALLKRESQTGGPATAEMIKAAIKDGAQLEALFGSESENLGIDLEHAAKLVQELQNVGVTVDAKLYYPVIVISSDQNNQQVESLIWMSEKERLALDIYPITKENNYAPYLARLRTEGSQVTRYVLFDDQSNLRIGSNELPGVISQISALLNRKQDSIIASLSRLSNELTVIGLLLDWLVDAINSSSKNKIKTMDVRRAKAEEDLQQERSRYIQLFGFRLNLEDLNERKELLATKLGEN